MSICLPAGIWMVICDCVRKQSLVGVDGWLIGISHSLMRIARRGDEVGAPSVCSCHARRSHPKETTNSLPFRHLCAAGCLSQPAHQQVKQVLHHDQIVPVRLTCNALTHRTQQRAATFSPAANTQNPMLGLNTGKGRVQPRIPCAPTSAIPPSLLPDFLQQSWVLAVLTRPCSGLLARVCDSALKQDRLCGPIDQEKQEWTVKHLYSTARPHTASGCNLQLVRLLCFNGFLARRQPFCKAQPPTNTLHSDACCGQSPCLTSGGVLSGLKEVVVMTTDVTAAASVPVSSTCTTACQPTTNNSSSSTCGHYPVLMGGGADCTSLEGPATGEAPRQCSIIWCTTTAVSHGASQEGTYAPTAARSSQTGGPQTPC